MFMKSPADVSHYRLLNNVLGVIHTAGPHARTCTCPLTMIIRAMSLQSSRLAARMEKSMSSGCDAVMLTVLLRPVGARMTSTWRSTQLFV